MSRKLRFSDDELSDAPIPDKPKKPKRKQKFRPLEEMSPEREPGRADSDLRSESGSEGFRTEEKAMDGGGRAAEGFGASAAEGDGADAKPRRDTRHDSKTPETASTADTPPSERAADTSAEPESSSGKLKFTKEEKKIGRLEQKSDKYGEKLGKAREKLPVKKVRKKERVFNEKSQKAKSKLTFEKETIPIGEAKWNVRKKKSIPRKAAGAVKTAGVNKLHGKIYEVEQENVGTQAAHRAELLGESAYRGGKKLTHSAYRFVRNRPYRKVSKLEVKSLKNDMKLSYQKALRDNPKLASNPVSRFFQKRSIKKEYAAALRNAKQSGKTAKQAVGFVQKTGQLVTGLVRKNPILLIKIGILMLMIFAIMAMFSMCGTIFSGGSALIGGTSYAAGDTDIDLAELAYTEWETDLLLSARNAESTHPGYDEYRYNIGDISHDPYELMGFLTAVYEDFTYSEVESVLRQIFNEQYNLSFVEEIEIRYRTEYYTDDDGNEHSYEVAYNYYILNVNLTAQSFFDVIYYKMNADQYKHFELLMLSKGNRQYVDNPFDFNWLPYVTSYYGYRVHPITGEKNYHKGVDIGLPTGTEIHAGFDGTVTAASYDSSYGNYVVIQMRLENGSVIEAKYAHCHTLLVSAGQTVAKGDIIATVGNTGDSTGPHLHLEVLKDGVYLNALYFAVTGDEGNGRALPGSPGGIAIPDYSGEAMSDGSYAALIEWAEKYLGFPYVFGGSSPSTSFDCSGYICWIYNQSGAASVGRTTAQGLYNLCTPVSAANAQPGDLIFFTGTYSAGTPVTHVGLYVGNGMMIHCGSPIQYTSINSSYWQSHFYSFGRLSG